MIIHFKEEFLLNASQNGLYIIHKKSNRADLVKSTSTKYIKIYLIHSIGDCQLKSINSLLHFNRT